MGLGMLFLVFSTSWIAELAKQFVTVIWLLLKVSNKCLDYNIGKSFARNMYFTASFFFVNSGDVTTFGPQKEIC